MCVLECLFAIFVHPYFEHYDQSSQQYDFMFLCFQDPTHRSLGDLDAVDPFSKRQSVQRPVSLVGAQAVNRHQLRVVATDLGALSHTLDLQVSVRGRRGR